MSASEFQFACLLDPRLSAHATSPLPVWLWSEDGARILWANPNGATIFNADSPAALEAQRYGPTHTAATQIARLAATLPANSSARLERLRGFGAGVGGTLTCSCSRLVLDNKTSAILVVATTRAGPDLSLAERVRWLLNGCEAPVAAFSAAGALLHATPAIHGSLGEARDVTALGAESLAETACLTGYAAGEIPAGMLSIARTGSGAATVLLATLDAPSQIGAKTPGAPIAAPAEISMPAQAASPDRRFPLRFVWQMDGDGRFTLTSDEFIRLIGPQTASVLGRPWNEISAKLALDPNRDVARALASQDTWSGVVIAWPVDGSDERLPVELSALPVFDRDRSFRGYRGFGVCRDIARLEALATARSGTLTPTIFVPVEDERPADVFTTRAENVLPFRPAPVTPPAPAMEEPAPALTPVERSAFSELARRLTDRLKKPADAQPETKIEPRLPEPATPERRIEAIASNETASERPILDRLPIGVLVYRFNDLLYANRAFLDWTGYKTLHQLSLAGGLDTLFIETGADKLGRNGEKTLAITTHTGEKLPVEGRLFSTAWDGDNALVLMLNIAPVAAPANGERHKASEMAMRGTEAENRELRAILDTATDGVIVIDRDGRVLSANKSAEALFGYEAADFKAFIFGDLFAPESRRPALDYLDRLTKNGTAILLNEGREVIGRVRQGGLIPLFMTIGKIGEAGEKYCAVFRDITAWKKTEEELLAAKRQAENASSAKSEFLAKVSHEIRTPLNAIIGFSEVMMEERFGPVGNERYRAYLKDIHSSGGHLVSLLNDLLDLSKIEAGKLDLTFASVSLNDITQQCVAVMQPQANRDRIIIRTSLPQTLPQIVADARSVRQIVLNLLSNSVKFTGAGGQVIVSTALTDDNEVVLRVRDTGSGMSEKDIQTALEPFRQLATARIGSGGTGLGLPITKALAEANHARFKITSEVDSGTLVEVAFPATRVLAE